MNNVMKLMFFLIYLILIFYINNVNILLILFIFNFLIMFISKIKIIKSVINVIKVIPFIFFTILINCIIVNYEYGLYIGVRLLLAYMVSYILINVITIRDFINAFEIIMKPLQIFNINVKEITLIIAIAISIIPYIIEELQQKKYSLKSKSIKIGFGNYVIIIKSILVSLIIKTKEYENALLAKGYYSRN